jgi:hypothetical protein
MKTAMKNRKQLIIMTALAVLAIVIFSRNVLNVGASAPAPVAEKAGTAQDKKGNESAARNSLDPSLRLGMLKTAENTEYKGNGRNIFKSMPDIPAPVQDPMTHHQVYTVINKPPPPPITLKFYGFASSVGEPKKVFLSQGDDIFIAKEGDIVDRRYKVVRIGPNSVDIEDVLNNNTQPIPLTEGPIPGQGPGM